MTEQAGSCAGTGLLKKCPRCDRNGTIIRLFAKKFESAPFAIVWDGPARNPFSQEHDIDTGIDLADLLNEKIGCGYDAATEKLT